MSEKTCARDPSPKTLLGSTYSSEAFGGGHSNAGIGAAGCAATGGVLDADVHSSGLELTGGGGGGEGAAVTAFAVDTERFSRS
jgi:hypothetical protein